MRTPMLTRGLELRQLGEHFAKLNWLNKVRFHSDVVNVYLNDEGEYIIVDIYKMATHDSFWPR
jgi:hypothetical protein